MSKKYYIVIAVIVIVLVAAAIILSQQEFKKEKKGNLLEEVSNAPSEAPAALTDKNQQAPSTLPNQTPSAVVPPTQEQIVITATDNGFSPTTVTIKKGEVVTFKNGSSLAIWPASGKHPTHELYPEKGGCINSKFDACRGLNPGEEWSFKFDYVGTWPFHDHLNASHFGKIIVTE